MRESLRALVVAAAVGCLSAARPAAAREAGDVIVVDNIGVPLYTHNFDTNKDIGVGDKLMVSEFIGAHYFVTSTIRVGMMFQWTEQYSGDLAPGSDHFTTFALLPQIGWTFYDHFSAAAIFTYAARAAGKDAYDFGVQALLGYSLPITKTAAFNMALEIPYNFRLARTLGITPLLGLTLDL